MDLRQEMVGVVFHSCQLRLHIPRSIKNRKTDLRCRPVFAAIANMAMNLLHDRIFVDNSFSREIARCHEYSVGGHARRAPKHGRLRVAQCVAIDFANFGDFDACTYVLRLTMTA